MEHIVYRGDSRGHANYGWLDTWHTFSFANYYDPQRLHFGALRVLNDDRVSAGRGFPTHPHDNMEIISIPLFGDLEHKDSMDNISVIKQGDIQVMSAGTGITHSEYNKNADREVKFLQIWVIPDKRNVQPRYGQISIAAIAKENELFQILSPHKEDKGVWIHQQAWFHMGHLKPGWQGIHKLKDEQHGVYVFLIEGEVSIADQDLQRRDGIGIRKTAQVSIEVKKEAQLLLMEVPMQD